MKRLLALAVWLFIFTSCRSPVSLQKSESVFYTPQISTTTPVDSSSIIFAQPYKAKLDSTMNEVIGQSQIAMEKGQPESVLGNFVADLCYESAVNLFKNYSKQPVDFCVLNNGGLRSSLPAGSITRRNVYELMPFDNELVVVTLSPDSVKSLLNYIAEKGGVPVANLQMRIKDKKPGDVMIGGKPYDPTKSYNVATSDYLSNGGDNMIMFSGAMQTESLGIKIRDAIINYISDSGKKQMVLKPATDGRISN